MPRSSIKKARVWALPACALVAGLLSLPGCNNTPVAGTQASGPNPTPAPAPATYDRYWNDLARWFAGLPALGGSKTVKLDTLAAAAAHRAHFDAQWNRKDSVLLGPMRQWAQAEFPKESADTGIALYPLSGSDFMHIHQFFPRARQYVFFARESEGNFPDSGFVAGISHAEASYALRNMKTSMRTIFDLTFQITEYMMRDLARGRINGHLPILMAFLARTGNEVLKVNPIFLDDAGEVQVSESQTLKQNAQDSVVTGFRFLFRAGANAPVQTLDYWSVDIDNTYQRRYPEFIRYLNGLQPARTYFKAASYLMHYEHYTQVREAIVGISDFVLQDDSGLPYAILNDGRWDVAYYGKYDKPKLTVWGGFQPELKRLYQSSPNIRPLPFGTGYTNREYNCNLQIARKRKGASTRPDASAAPL